ncbi:putative Ig domain-containing protein, partial [Salmonella enterica]|nr:putative Ig domain-containing protein [Salmonella enterica]
PVTGVSPVDGALTYSVSPALPAGLGLNSTNGVISGTPSAESPGTTYTMTVRDGRSAASNSAEFYITVLPRFIVTQVTYVRAVTRNAPVNINIASISGGSGTYSASVSPSLPIGLTLNVDSVSGVTISGITAEAQSAQDYAITIKDDLVDGTSINRMLNLAVN